MRAELGARRACPPSPEPFWSLDSKKAGSLGRQPLPALHRCSMDYKQILDSEANLDSIYPPSSNRGVVFVPPCSNPVSKTPLKGVPLLASDPSMPLQAAFFDWYQASIDCPLDEILLFIERFYLESVYDRLIPYDFAVEGSEGSEVLCQLRGEWVENNRQPPYMYSRALMVREGEDRVKVAEVHWGGVNSGVFVRSTSDNARVFSAFVRETWPEHSCSRVDVALDFCEKGAFESLHSLGVRIASEFGLKIRRQGDWDLGEGGRTVTIGSRQSVLYIRIYEKGYERKAAGVADAPLDWVRFEVEVKPAKSDGKRKAAFMEPYQFFGASRALRYVAEVLSAMSLEPVRLHTQYRPAEFIRALNHMCYQYSDVLAQYLSETCEGDLEAFALGLLRIAEEQRMGKKRIRKEIMERACQIRASLDQSE